MRVITSLARGVGKTAGWTAATLVAVGASAIDQMGEAGEVVAESYETSYDSRTAYLDLTPDERKAARATALRARREALAAKPKAATAKKSVAA